jgi:hypothetical protein
MTHLWWQQCHCDLYRIALVGRRESLSKDSINSLDPAFVKHCQRRCFEHAKAMAEMFALVLQFEKGVPVSDLDLPVLSYQCANTLYYTLAICGHEFDISYATVTEMATSCLKVAKQAAPGPAAGAIVSTLVFISAKQALPCFGKLLVIMFAADCWIIRPKFSRNSCRPAG